MNGKPAAAAGRSPLVVLMGPTASGKSDLALALADTLPLEIVSVDSAMVYRGMDIGTAKPTAEERARVRHHLIDLLPPFESYSAARFCDDARAAIDAVRAAGKLPLLVGGTMLYFNALRGGLSNLPQADAAIREQIVERASREGWPALHDELARVDAVAAARIHPNDPQRIQRALEVWHLTGVPLSRHHEVDNATAWGERAIQIVAAVESRARLHARIEQRFDRMLAGGLVDEVAALRADARLSPDLPSMRAVGYRQVWNYLAGEWRYDEMRERGITSTRQLAKRQFTWLRRERDAVWFDVSERGLAAVREHLERRLEELV